jgi:hypothetical protein
MVILTLLPLIRVISSSARPYPNIHMSYNLFLDDERDPQKVTWIELPNVPWVVVRTYESFVSHISRFGMPAIISFDHDLADEHYERYFEARNGDGIFRYDGLKYKTGRDAAIWLTKYCQTFEKPVPQFFTHTMNPYGAKNIQDILNNFKLSPKKAGRKPVDESANSSDA